MTLPYHPHTCIGPCSKPYRDAVDAYDQALTVYEEALAARPALLAAWRIPLLYPAAPVPPEPVTIRAHYGDPVWCGRCTRMIRQALDDLDDLASLAQATVDGHRDAGARYGKTGLHLKTSAPSPSPITDTLDELYGALVDVEDNWREFRNHQPRPQRARNGHARRLAISYLRDELDAILAHPASDAFGFATLAWQRRLRALTKSDAVSRRSPVRCRRCSERKMRLEDDGYYKCGTCGTLMSQVEHDREFAEQAEEQEAHAS
ncbi:hypothetical protein [Streptosporangium sp. NPDC049078]|uniref:hypothetical protein n=1 Tax=Streptosporangium sp. NPDC049078 TaxID=3155767 RepID=UPI003425B32E